MLIACPPSPPAGVISAVKLSGRLALRFSTVFESASILFVELCGFSTVGARLSPEEHPEEHAAELINLLNAVRS